MINTVIDFGKNRAAMSSRNVTAFPVKKPRQDIIGRTRPKVVSVTKDNMRQHEVMSEAQNKVMEANNNLKSSLTALAAANAANDKLHERLEMLEKTNSYLVNQLDKAKDIMRRSLDNPPLGKKTIDVLERCNEFLGELCRDGKCDDHCSACLGASDLADDVWDVLHPDKPTVTDKATPDTPASQPASVAKDCHDSPSNPPAPKGKRGRRKRSDSANKAEPAVTESTPQ